MYTLDYSLAQLDRLQDIIDSGQPIRIIHMLCEERSWEDRYIVLLDCDARVYTMLLLL